VHISSGLVEEFRCSLLSAAFNVPDRGESGNREITERAGRGTYDGLVQIRRQGVATKSISHERIGFIAVVADVGQSPDRRAVTGKADGRDGRFAPPPLAWLDGLICARNIVIRTASALWPLFVAFLLLQYGSAGSWTRRPILTNLFLASPRGQKARVVSVFEGYNMKLIANRDATYQYVQPILGAHGRVSTGNEHCEMLGIFSLLLRETARLSTYCRTYHFLTVVWAV
jgi:hypothetical protein